MKDASARCCGIRSCAHRSSPCGIAASGTSGTLVIVSDTQLNKDHFGDIVIGASNVTLDCKGHTVSGPGTGSPYYGILLDGTTGVTIRNCKITAFENGIIVAGWSGPSSGRR